MAQLQSVTCHMGSHSVTCYPTQVNTPCLNSSHAGRYSIYLPWRDGRLSWPSWLDSAPAGNRTSDLWTTSPTLSQCNHQDSHSQTVCTAVKLTNLFTGNKSNKNMSRLYIVSYRRFKYRYRSFSVHRIIFVTNKMSVIFYNFAYFFSLLLYFVRCFFLRS